MSRIVRVLSCSAVALFAFAGGAWAQSPWDGPVASSGPIPVDTPEFKRAAAAAMATYRAEDLRLETGAARSARALSRSQFESLGRDEAFALAQQQFPEWMVDPLDEVDLAPGLRIVGYSSPTAASVVNGRGRRMLLVSSQPLAVRDGDELAPVALGLRSTAAGYEPARAAVDVTLPAQADDFLRLERGGVALRPAGAGAVDATLAENRLFFPDVATDTDYVATPTRGGAEVMWQLRSSGAPERLGLDVELPQGASMRIASAVTGASSVATVGNVEIVRDGQVLSTISAPVAVDADGQEIEAAFAFVDGDLVVDIAHRSADAHYPILVDPEVRDVWGGYDFTGSCGGGPTSYAPGIWTYGQTASFTPACNDPFGSNGAGLWIKSEPWHYNDGQTGYWKWGAPSGAYIAAAWFDGMRHQAAGTYLYTGLTGSGAWGALAFHPSEFYYGQYSLTPDSPNKSWEAVLGLSISGSYTRPHLGLGGARGINLLLGDESAPVVRLTSIVGGLNAQNQSRWVDDLQTYVTARVRGADGSEANPWGLGLHQLGVIRDGSGAVIGEVRHGCAGHRSSGCPKTWEAEFPLYLSQLPEGHSAIQTAVTDIVGRRATGPHWTQRIDRTPPVIHLSGDIIDHATDGQLPANPGLSIHSTDGADSAPTTQRSGVKRIRVLLDGQSVLDSTNPDATCDSCPRGQTWTASLAALVGDHTVTVQAWDYVGHLASRTVRVRGQDFSGWLPELNASCADYQANAPRGEAWVCPDPAAASEPVRGPFTPSPEDEAAPTSETFEFPPSEQDEDAGDSSTLLADPPPGRYIWTWARTAKYGVGRIMIGRVAVELRTGLSGRVSYNTMSMHAFWGPAVRADLRMECKYKSNDLNCSWLEFDVAPNFDHNTHTFRHNFRHQLGRRYYINFNVYLWSLGSPGKHFHLKLYGFGPPAVRSDIFTCRAVVQICSFD